MIQASLTNKIIDACSNEIYLIDAQSSTYMQVNQSAQNQLGYCLAELQQMHPWQLAQDFTEATWQRQLQPLLSGSQTGLLITSQHTRKDSSRYPVQLNIQMHTEPSGELLLVIARDLSQGQYCPDTKIENIREQERTRIAREIHDQLGGNLVAVKMMLHTLAGRLPSDQPWLADQTRMIDTLVADTIEVAQQIVRELRPDILNLGLAAALKWQLGEFEKQYNIHCTFFTSESEILLLPDQATAIFRMVQEALNNIAKHAQATAVSMTMRCEHNAVQLTIADNGCGLGVGYASKPQRFGLLGMTERCREIGATIEIATGPDNGCQITITIPLTTREIHER